MVSTNMYVCSKEDVLAFNRRGPHNIVKIVDDRYMDRLSLSEPLFGIFFILINLIYQLCII